MVIDKEKERAIECPLYRRLQEFFHFDLGMEHADARKTAYIFMTEYWITTLDVEMKAMKHRKNKAHDSRI